MNATKQISPWQFAVFRIVFGVYLAAHFVQLIPWAGELFSAEGLLPSPALNFTHGVLPNPLAHWQSAAFAQGFVAVLAVLAVLFALGVGRRVCAVLLWYGWACLFNRNNLILNPGLPYVGLLLLLCALVPKGEPLALTRRRDEDWSMPAAIYWGAWALLAAGYTYSGVWKLFSPSWVDGSALVHLLNNPLARPGWIRDLLLQFPDWATRVLTWSALAGELLALPLLLTRRGRAIGWVWMLAMHLGILLVVDFADLTLGMVMIHLFTFDPAWLPARKDRECLVLFDGECGLCDRTVQFLLAEDQGRTLRFTPLQGKIAGLILQRHDLHHEPLSSLVLVEKVTSCEERVFTKSTAVAHSLINIGGIWRPCGAMLLLTPRFARDWAYEWVAEHRLRWFGAPQSCRLPAGLDRGRFVA